MALSDHALEKMGFERIPEDLVLEARFCSLNVYEIRGILSDEKAPLDPSLLKRTDNVVTFSLGDSVNDLCQILAGDNFTEDEEKWRNDTKTTPPYLLVLTEVQEPAKCSPGYWKQENDEIITYECFTEAKESLTKLENARTTAVVSALSALLSSDKRPVDFVPIGREVFAETSLGKRLRDWRLQFSGVAYAASRVQTSGIGAKIESAFQLSNSLHPKVGYFFSLATKEKDPLKKFLYLFLTIEVHTHRTFKELDYANSVSQLHTLPERIAQSSAEFYIEAQKATKSLAQRFMWCSILCWRDITDEDIEAFKKVKRARDRIYHGEDVNEDKLPISRTQSLATKLLRCNSCASAAHNKAFNSDAGKAGAG